MKYIHLRIFNDPALIRNNRKVRSFPKAHGGITIAYQKQNNNEYKVAFAICSEKDNYCKRTGRDEATKHMLNGKTITMHLNNVSSKPLQIIDNLERHYKYKITLDHIGKESMKILKKALHDL